MLFDFHHFQFRLILSNIHDYVHTYIHTYKGVFTIVCVYVYRELRWYVLDGQKENERVRRTMTTSYRSLSFIVFPLGFWLGSGSGFGFSFVFGTISLHKEFVCVSVGLSFCNCIYFNMHTISVNCSASAPSCVIFSFLFSVLLPFSFMFFWLGRKSLLNTIT